MESGQGGDPSVQTPSINADCPLDGATSAKITTATAEPSVAQESQDVDSETCVTITSTNDNNNNSQSLLDKVSKQINTFEYMQEVESTYAPLTWQPSDKTTNDVPSNSADDNGHSVFNVSTSSGGAEMQEVNPAGIEERVRNPAEDPEMIEAEQGQGCDEEAVCLDDNQMISEMAAGDAQEANLEEAGEQQLSQAGPEELPHYVDPGQHQQLIGLESQSLQVYPSDLLPADLSNVQGSKIFSIVKTEPSFSADDAKDVVPTISIKQEASDGKDGGYMDMRNVPLPSLAMLPPFSSSRGLALANPDQLHLIQPTTEDACPVSDSSRLPFILSASNQTTVLPSLFKMSNHSAALTTLNPAAIAPPQGQEASAPLLSMQATSFTAIAQSSINSDQPYFIIPVSGSQPILAFATQPVPSADVPSPASSINNWAAVDPSSEQLKMQATSAKPPSKTHVCNLCGKQFSSRAVHNLHMRSHSGEKPYPCSVCGRHFSQKTSLTRHMRSHTGERPYPCDICGKCFSDKERVKIHMRSHTGEKPFPCQVCGKHFSQKSTVKRHMSVHTGERPFKCDTCGKGFANRGNLNSHIRTHSSSAH